MITWFKRNNIESEEYKALHKRITNLELRIDDLEAFQSNIRNMARKIQTRRKKDEEQEDEPQDIKSTVLIPT